MFNPAEYHPNIARFHAQVQDYLEGKHPYPFGSFYTAVLSCDFIEMCGRADATNQLILYQYAQYMHNEMPGRTGDPSRDWWGSKEAVENRIKDQAEAHYSTEP